MSFTLSILACSLVSPLFSSHLAGHVGKTLKVKLLILLGDTIPQKTLSSSSYKKTMFFWSSSLSSAFIPLFFKNLLLRVQCQVSETLCLRHGSGNSLSPEQGLLRLSSTWRIAPELFFPRSVSISPRYHLEILSSLQPLLIAVIHPTYPSLFHGDGSINCLTATCHLNKAQVSSRCYRTRIQKMLKCNQLT